jgi:hypothetical protein
MPNVIITKAALVSARQSNGRLVPVFPSIMQNTKNLRAKQNDYIERMIARDRESERTK